MILNCIHYFLVSIPQKKKFDLNVNLQYYITLKIYLTIFEYNNKIKQIKVYYKKKLFSV